MILLGTFKEHRLHAVLASLGVVLGAVYMLWMVQRVIFGKIVHEANEKVKDLSPREILTFAPILVLIVVMGVYPKPFLDRMHGAVGTLIRQVSVEERMAPQADADADPAPLHGPRAAVAPEKSMQPWLAEAALLDVPESLAAAEPRTSHEASQSQEGEP